MSFSPQSWHRSAFSGQPAGSLQTPATPGSWIYQAHGEHCLLHVTSRGTRVCFPAHRYLDKSSLSVIMCVGGRLKEEKLLALLQAQRYRHSSPRLSYSLAPENVLQIQNMYKNKVLFSPLSAAEHTLGTQWESGA